MSQETIKLIEQIAVLLLPAVVGYIGGVVKSHSIARKADMLMLRIQLIYMHDIAMESGKITRYSYRAFNEVWDLYHNGYKGNTLTDRFHDEFNSLPITE